MKCHQRWVLLPLLRWAAKKLDASKAVPSFAQMVSTGRKRIFTWPIAQTNLYNFCRKIQGMLVRSHFFCCGKNPTGKPHGPVDWSTGRQISLNEDLPSHSPPGTGFLCGFFPVFLPGTPKPTIFKWMFGWLNNPFPM